MFIGERHETDLARFDLEYLARRKKDAKIYMLLDFHETQETGQSACSFVGFR